jgi:hypothetical protein
MKQFLLSTPAQIVIWLTVLVILVAIGGYIVGNFRGRSSHVQLSANDLLTNFREMHHRGDIADVEFRNIKTVLAVKLQEQLNVSGSEGSAQQSESTKTNSENDNSESTSD